MSRRSSAALPLWLALLALTYPLAGTAAERLSGNELKALITGNTVEGKSMKGVRSKTFFSPDGAVHSERDGESYQGKWWVDEDGRRCRQWDGDSAVSCRVILKGDKGNYRVMKDFRNVMRGMKQTGTWERILEGNPHGL